MSPVGLSTLRKYFLFIGWDLQWSAKLQRRLDDHRRRLGGKILRIFPLDPKSPRRKNPGTIFRARGKVPGIFSRQRKSSGNFFPPEEKF